MEIKCKECGQTFEEGLNECPNCGCPASSCVSTAAAETELDCEHEKVVQSLAEGIHSYLMIEGWFLFIVAIFAGLFCGNFGTFLLGLLGGGLILSAHIIAAKVIRAFLMVYANISINLFKIERKIK